MNRTCPSDGSTLKVKGTTKILDCDLVVRVCPHCGEVTFWDEHEEVLRRKGQLKLKAMLDD